MSAKTAQTPGSSAHPWGRGDRASRRPTRLLLISSIYPTADRPEAGAFVARRVEALRARGVQVTVAAPSVFGRNPWRRHASVLRRAVSAHGPFDGIESHVLFPASLIAVLMARILGVPLVVYAHGHDVGVAARRTPVHRALASLVARSASRVLTNSTDTARYVAALGARAIVIPPGVDLERFHPGDRRAARQRLGLPADALIALFVGLLERRKGADVFATAIRLTPGWTGVMVGQGALARGLAGDDDSVRLVGAIGRDAVPEWMIAADVVIVPSRREPLGLAAIEALACGIPVIASAVGGLRDVVRDGETGILVPPGDPGAVSTALRELQDPARRAQLAHAARGSVREHDLRTTTAEMAAVWSELGIST